MRYSLTLLVTLLSLLAFAQNNGNEQRQPVTTEESEPREFEEGQPPLVLYGDKEKGILEVTAVSGAERKLITLGLLTNPTDKPIRWKLEVKDGDKKPFIQVPRGPQQTTVQPGKTRPIALALLAREIPVGNYRVQARISVEQLSGTAITLDINELFELIFDILPDEEEACLAEVGMENVKVTDGQGIGEGKLELRITGHADTDEATWPSSAGSVQVSEGDTMPINMPITTIEIPEGETRTVSIQADVLEIDTGLAGSDDFGTASGTMELSCDNLPQNKPLTVTINGSNDGEVKVKFEAVRAD